MLSRMPSGSFGLHCVRTPFSRLSQTPLCGGTTFHHPFPSDITRLPPPWVLVTTVLWTDGQTPVGLLLSVLWGRLGSVLCTVAWELPEQAASPVHEDTQWGDSRLAKEREQLKQPLPLGPRPPYTTPGCVARGQRAPGYG